ncbi:hypothetical protein JW978_00565 [Candidatus Dojkabacteria bacterium]|nr:hypothetical protein [Candidatus Dojkabacteria bacterium]
MIDTITLRLDEKKFKINNKSKFSIIRKGNGYYDRIHEATKSKDYFPSLRIRSRGYSKEYLYIEFSAPKLLFGNNLEELSQNDIQKLFEVLQKTLDKMDVYIPLNELNKAKVVKVHFGKNVILPSNIFPSMIIDKLRGTNWSNRFSGLIRDYNNNGSSLRIGNKSREIIIYDKVAELTKEKANKQLVTLLRNNGFQILRLEIRLKMESVILRELALEKDNNTLVKLTSHYFLTDLCKSYWDILAKELISFSYEDISLETIYAEILMSNPKMRIRTVNNIFAMYVLTKEIGLKRVREIIEYRYSRETWYSLNQLMKKLPIDKKTENWITEIERQLINYKPIRLNNFTKQHKIPYTVS